MYHLEIYEPDSKEDVLWNTASKQPFLTINVGDFINQSLMIRDGGPQTERLQVVEVEHIIWNNDQQLNHKLMVYTQIEN